MMVKDSRAGASWGAVRDLIVQTRDAEMQGGDTSGEEGSAPSRAQGLHTEPLRRAPLWGFESSELCLVLLLLPDKTEGLGRDGGQHRVCLTLGLL